MREEMKEGGKEKKEGRKEGGRQGKEAKEGKEGKEGKQGKEGKEGKEAKEGKEGKEGQAGQAGKAGEGKQGKEGQAGKEGREEVRKEGLMRLFVLAAPTLTHPKPAQKPHETKPALSRTTLNQPAVNTPFSQPCPTSLFLMPHQLLLMP